MYKMKSSGVEWIGDIPEHWETKAIREVFQEVTEKNKSGAVKTALKFTYGKIVRKENFDADNDNYVANTILNYTIVEPDMIMLNGLNLNFDFVTQRVAIVEEKGIITSAYIAMKVSDDNIILPEYAMYLLKSYDYCKAFHNMGNGVRQSLNFSELKRNYIILPSVEEQQKISAYLDRKCNDIDYIISGLKKQTETLADYKKSLITETVTKGLNPDVKMRDSGIEWVGEIPEHWEVKRLKYLINSSLQYGANETGIEYDEKLPRYIRITDITADNQLKENGKLSLPYEIAKPYLLKNNDILFARSGATVGKSFIYKSKYGTCAFAGYLIKASIKRTVSPDFVYYYTLGAHYDLWKDSVFTQATIQNIGADKYVNLPVAIPPIEEQKAIAEYLDEKCTAIDNSVREKQAMIEKLAQYKKSLIYEVVTGKKEI